MINRLTPEQAFPAYRLELGVTVRGTNRMPSNPNWLSSAASPTESIQGAPMNSKGISVPRPTVKFVVSNRPIPGTDMPFEFNVVISVGTTSVFPYIAAPMLWAADNGYAAIEINPDVTNVTPVATHRIELPAGVALEKIWAGYQRKEK